MHYNGANSFLFANGTEIHKFKVKDSEINAILLCLGNISTDFSVDNMKKIKDMNSKVFNLMSRTNKTRHVSWHKICTCKCRLDTSVFNNKRRWNSDKCKCECKELIDKGRCDGGFIWNPSICEYKCDEALKETD